MDAVKQKVTQPSSFGVHDIFLINDNHKIAKVINKETVEIEKSFELKKAILMNQGSVSIYTNLFDSYIYICKRYVLDLIEECLK